MNTELLFQTIHAVNQFGTHGAVANRCEQFGLTEEEKGRANISVNTSILTSVLHMKYNSWYRLRQQHLETGCEKRCCASKRWPVKYSSHNVRKSLLQISCDSWEEVKNSTRWRRRMENNHSFCISSLGFYSRRTILGPVLVVPNVKTLDGYGIEVAIPSNADPANTSYVVISRETRPAAKRERTWLGWSRSGARGAAMRDRSFHHGGSWARTISESKKFIVVFVCLSVCVWCVSVFLCVCTTGRCFCFFFSLSLVAWQSTAALHVESMSDNSTAELQTDLRKDAVPCYQKVQHTSPRTVPSPPPATLSVHRIT